MLIFGSPWLTSILVFALAFVALFWGKRLIFLRFKALSKKTDNKVDDMLAEVLVSIKVFFMLAISLYVATYPFGLSAHTNSIIGKTVFVIVMIQIAISGNILIKFIMENYVLQKMSQDASNAAIISIAVFMTKLLLYIVLLLLTLNNFGIDVTALVAGLGVGGIAIALAVQSILGDLFASFTIVLDKPFLVGDFIVVGDNMGNVEKIGIKTTRVRSISGEQLIFPNGQLLQGQIKNFKRMQERRILFNLGVVYKTSMENVKKIPLILKEIIGEQEKARFERSHFKGYGEYALNFETVYWVEDPDFNVYMDIQQRINIKIYERFAKEGIEFAYPTQTIYGAGTK